jgi:5-methylthioribose kinase
MIDYRARHLGVGDEVELGQVEEDREQVHIVDQNPLMESRGKDYPLELPRARIELVRTP